LGTAQAVVRRPFLARSAGIVLASVAGIAPAVVVRRLSRGRSAAAIVLAASVAETVQAVVA